MTETIDEKFNNELVAKECIWHHIVNLPDSSSREGISKSTSNYKCHGCFGYKDACKGYVSMKTFWEQL